MRDFHLQIFCLKKKLKYWKKKKLEEESKCSNVYAGSLKSMLFSYDNFITYEKLFRATTGLEVEKFKVLYKNLDPGENCEKIKYHEPAKYKIGQIFCFLQAFFTWIKTRTSTKTCWH